jgi:hypothetical protein
MADDRKELAGENGLQGLLRIAIDFFLVRTHRRPPSSVIRPRVFPQCPVCTSEDLSRSSTLTVCNDCEWTSDTK